MEYRELGGTGEMVPEIGLGTWKYRGGPEPLRKGIELGATLIDTAEMYHTEDAVGKGASRTIWGICCGARVKNKFTLDRVKCVSDWVA